MDVVKFISEGLVCNVFFVKVNGEVWDVNCFIIEDVKLQLFMWNDKDGKVIFWYLLVYFMVEVLEVFYFNVKFGIGLVIDIGFYYDVDIGDQVLSINDLEVIEKKMIEFVWEKNEFVCKEVSKVDVIVYFEEKGDQYKFELLEDLEDGFIIFYM